MERTDGRDDKNEVLNDFKASLEKVDFGSYDPSSAEFQQALDLGLMWFLLMTMAGIIKPSEVKSGDEIGEEILLAKRLFQKSIDTGDSSYRDTAKESLKTAGALIKKAYAKLPTGDERAKLKAQEAEISELSARLST